MQIINKKPLKAYLFRLRFGKEASYEKGVIFVFNQKIYTRYPLSEHLIVHEETHIQQQGNLLGSIKWVMMYMLSASFRLRQELEAYRAQYKYIFKHSNRNEANTLLLRISKDLSSEMYGDIISFDEAKRLIRN